MTTDTTNKEAGALKPCPMCNASLSEATASGYHHHPANGCIFSGFELSRDDVAAWNRRALAEVQAETATCEWSYDKDSYSWDTACGEKWQFTADGPEENGMHFCHNCGGKLVIAAPAASGGERS